MAQIHLLTLGPLQTNCYLVAGDGRRATVIDPAWNGEEIADAAASEGYEIGRILLTHAHFDHVGGLAALKKATGAPVYIHQDAVPMLRDAPAAASAFGLSLEQPPEPDELLEAGQIVTVGDLRFHVLFTPGHAPGHVSFYLPEDEAVFDGDVLFRQGIGRTDFPDSDHETLLRAIRRELLVLPDETRVFPGHGPPTTIGYERERNPFLQETSYGR